MVDHSDTTAEQGRDHHHHGMVAGKVVGQGLGGLAILAAVLVLFGPFLLAPLTLAIQSLRAVDNTPMEWVVALVVGLGVLGVQFLFAVQRNPAVRTLTVALASFIFMVGAWLFFTRPGEDLPSYAEPLPWWERLTQTGWIVIVVGTIIYSAVYLYLLHRLDDRAWVRRLQFLGGRRARAGGGPA
jgi:hypothetical protein